MNNKCRNLIFGIMVVSSLMLFGCNEKKPQTTPNKGVVKVNPKTPQQHQVNQSQKPNKNQNKGEGVMYNISHISSKTSIEMNTPWKTSPDKKYKATVEGKGEKAEEEGFSQIIIKNIATKELEKFTLKNEEKLQLAAKYVEWIDDDYIFVIIGNPFGTTTRGGQIYKLNVKTGEALLYAKVKNSREEFTDIKKTSNGFSYRKYIYDDDNLTNGHVVRGKLSGF